MFQGWCLIFLSVFLTACLADDLQLGEHWTKYKKNFKKSFQNSQHETVKRLKFERTVKSILQHNLKADMGEETYKKAVNAFTDYTQEEIEIKLCGLKFPKNYTRPVLSSPPPKTSSRALPVNHDWRDFNAVTPVKNQGTCGSCWTFSVAGTLEGAFARRDNSLASDLSEQDLLDCSGNYGTTGCDGGWPEDAFKYVKDKGISKYECYPYENKQGQCRSNKKCNVGRISSFYQVPKGDETTMKQYLFDYGPISVTVHVNDNFSAYSDGIYYDNSCNKRVNHAVLLVGYGTENGRDYWTIKNSWGSGWGDKGYIRIARNAGSLCGVADYASFPYI